MSLFRKALSRLHYPSDTTTHCVRWYLTYSLSLRALVEQDHRNIKRRIKLMTGFKSFKRAQTILTGIELIYLIRKGQSQYPDGDGLSPADQFYLLTA